VAIAGQRLRKLHIIELTQAAIDGEICDEFAINKDTESTFTLRNDWCLKFAIAFTEGMFAIMSIRYLTRYVK
jgi:hypothetical protein